MCQLGKISRFLVKFKCNIPVSHKIILSLYSSGLIKKKVYFPLEMVGSFHFTQKFISRSASSTTSETGLCGVEQKQIQLRMKQLQSGGILASKSGIGHKPTSSINVSDANWCEISLVNSLTFSSRTKIH